MGTYAKEFTINYTPLTSIGSLEGVQVTGAAKATALKSVCPECDEPHTVKQQYVGTECEHGPFTSKELGKAKVVDGGLIAVSAADAKGAKASDLPLNYLDLTIHPTSEVSLRTYPSGTAYVYYPKVANEQYGVLADLVAEPDFTFLGICNLQNNEKLVRLVRWNDVIVVQQLLYPEDLNPVTIPEIKYKSEFLEMMLQFAKPSEFDPDEYRNAKKAKMAELTGEGFVTPIAPIQSDDDAALAKLKLLMSSGDVN